MPEPEDKKEELKNEQAIIVVRNKSLEIEKQYTRLRSTNAELILKGLVKEKNEIEQLWKVGKISHSKYQEVVELANRRISTTSRLIPKSFSSSWIDAGKLAGNALADLAQKIGIDFASASLAGIAVWLAGHIDALRITRNWAKFTVEIFGKAGKDSASLFGTQFIPAGNEMLANARFVTDEMRNQFMKASFQIGLAIRGISGAQWQDEMERLLVTSQAFGISIDDMVQKLFSFQDIFRLTTGQAGTEIEKLTDVSLRLGVAPQRFLSLVSNLTDQFKLQRIQIGDVSQVFTQYFDQLRLGVNITEELTKRTITALGSLKEGRIAALLALTTGTGGAELGKELVGFYRGENMADRLDLVLDAFKQLQVNFPQVLKNEFAGVRMIMTSFGVQDFETGVRLYDAFTKNLENTSGVADAAEKAREILQGTKSASEQATTFVVNALNAIIRMIAIPALWFARGGDKELIKQYVSSMDSMQQAYAATEAGNYDLAQQNLDKANDAQATLEELRKDSPEKTQLDQQIAAVEESTKILTSIDSGMKASVQLASTQIEVAKQAYASLAGALTGPGMAGGAAAAAIRAIPTEQLIQAAKGMVQKLVIDISPQAAALLKVSQSLSTVSILKNTATG
jgi:hypothetical protein